MVSDGAVKQTKKTYRNIYKEYSLNNTKLNSDVKKMLDLFVLKLGGKKVLDIGCAQGRESGYLSSKDLQVTGVDFLEEFVDLAKSNYPKCKFVVGDMRKLPFNRDMFDGLWISASFLHIPKKDALETLKGFYRVLKKDGIIYLSVMEGDNDTLRENKQMKWGARQFSDYEDEEIKSIFNKAGFEVVDSKTVKTHWGPTFLHYFCKKVNTLL